MQLTNQLHRRLFALVCARVECSHLPPATHQAQPPVFPVHIDRTLTAVDQANTRTVATAINPVRSAHIITSPDLTLPIVHPQVDYRLIADRVHDRIGENDRDATLAIGAEALFGHPVLGDPGGAAQYCCGGAGGQQPHVRTSA